MKYLKKYKQFNEGYQDSVNISQSEFDRLFDILKEKLEPLGIVCEKSTYEDKSPVQYTINRPITMVYPKNIKYYKLTFKFNFTSIPGSILYFLSKALFEKPGEPLRDRIIAPVSTKFLDTVVDTIIVLCNQQIDNEENIISTVNPKTSGEAFEIVIEKLLELANTFSDRVCVGTSSNYLHPECKAIIIEYLKDLLNIQTTNKTDIYTMIKNIIDNSENHYKLYSDIKENNPILFSKLEDITGTAQAAKLGEMGF